VNVGFPVCWVAKDGSCVIGKPSNTGGLVSVQSVTEQVVVVVV
jgi:hypothetical protein